MKRIIFKLKSNLRITPAYSDVINLEKEYFNHISFIDKKFNSKRKKIDKNEKLFPLLKDIKEKKQNSSFLFNGITNFHLLLRVVTRHYECSCVTHIDIYNCFTLVFKDNEDLADQYKDALLQLTDVVEFVYIVGPATSQPVGYNIINQLNIGLDYQIDLEISEAWNRFKFLSSTVITSTRITPSLNKLRIGSYTGRGQKISIYDIESGWQINHSSFNSIPQIIPDETITPDESGYQFFGNNVNHGTNVQGVLISKHLTTDNIYGIVPQVSSYIINQEPLVELALMRAIVSASSKKGSIILLELARIIEVNNNSFSMPIEYGEPKNNNIIRKLIELATKCLGITVIEPAGNESSVYRDLDNQIHNGFFQEGLDYIEDSGAIMVGAVNYGQDNAIKYKLKNDSCYGRRVDTFVWGENIRTTDINNGYYDFFAQTSAASAIVAGICASLQSISVNEYGKAIPPLVLRSWLQNNPKKLDPSVDLTTVTFEMPKMSDLISKLENYHTMVV